MEFSGDIFPSAGLWLAVGLYAWLSVLAVRWADWGRLRDPDQLHVFLGAVVGLLVLWSLRTEVQPGFTWHLSAIVTLTLMYGWSLAVVAGSLALAGTTLAGLNDWAGFAPTALVSVMLPALMCQVVLALARAYLPKHFFVYVFVNAFFAAGLIALISGLTAAAVLMGAGAFSYERLYDNYLIFLPLMFFPEAVLNGWLMAIMVGFKPHWVRSFRDEEYLHGK
jgi:uncharacterized membrane protein